MDREKVIIGIRKCLSHKPCSVIGCPYENECAVEHLNDPLLRDALALLKEQKAHKFFVDESGKITPLPVVIRCKDCKHGKIHGIDVECVAHEEVCYDPEPWHPLDWFCADGER